MTAEFRVELLAAVRRRPRSLDLPYSMWTLQRLANFMAEKTGVRMVAETVRLILKKHDIVLSRPQHKVSSPDPDYQIKKDGGRRTGRPKNRRGVLLRRRVQP